MFYKNRAILGKYTTIVEIAENLTVVLPTDENLTDDMPTINGKVVIENVKSNIELLTSLFYEKESTFGSVEIEKEDLVKFNEWLKELKERKFDIDLLNGLYESGRLESYKIHDIIDTISNSNFYYIDIMEYDNDYNVGYYAVNELNWLNVPEEIEEFFDYSKYGKSLKDEGKIEQITGEMIIVK